MEPNLRAILAEIALCKVAMSLSSRTVLRYLAPVPGADLPPPEAVLLVLADLEVAADRLREVSRSACMAIQPPLPFPVEKKSQA